jgi:hypothetical protein
VSAAALPCICLGRDEECGCDDEERLAKNLAYHTPGIPPLEKSTRSCWAARIACTEGYPPAAENLRLDDCALARLWLESMLDYARDRGLLL